MAKNKKAKTLVCLLTLIPVVLMMIFIYCMSARTGEESGADSGKITAVVVRLLHSDYDDLPLSEQEAIFNETSFYVRKTAHFSEYAALAFFTVLHIYCISKKRRISLPSAFLFSALYASLDEWHQSFVAQRGPSVFDVGIDCCGALFGALIMLILLSIFIKSSKTFAFSN